jgi:hypothetical protein
VTGLSPRMLMRRFVRPPALLPLISICLSELRRDIASLSDSKWAEAPRRRTRELVSAIEEACDRQGMDAMENLAMSMMRLICLPDEEVLALGSALSEKLEELLSKAEKIASDECKRQTA